MAEVVGQIAYEVTLETARLVDGQRKVNAEVNKAASQFDTLKSKLTAVASAVSVYAAAMASINSAKLADEIRMLAIRVQLAAGSMQEGAQAMREIEQISRRTQTSVQANAEVFTRLNAAMKAMGGRQSDTLQLVESLSMAIKVSGASAVEAKAAMLQFGQALGSGKLGGDELRSLMETAPYLMRQLADGIGVPVGALKKLGEEGKLTADVVATAMLKASASIKDDFSKVPQTLDGAITALEDSAGRANKAFDDLAGTSAALTGATKGLGEVLDELAKKFGGVSNESDDLARSTAISSWASTTKTVLSYVVDAADLTWQTLSVLGRNVAFVFQSVGAEIGGIGAQISSVLRGDFAGAKAIGEAMKADADKRRAELDAKDRETLARTKLAGQQMRDAWDQGAGGGRGFINPTAQATPPKLKSPVTDNNKKPKKEKQESDPLGSFIDDKVNAQNERDAKYQQQLTKAVNPVDALRQEYEAKLELVTQYEQMIAQAGVDATEQGQLARTQITNEYELQRIALAEQTFRSQGEAQAFLMDTLNSLSQTASSSIVGLINGTMSAQDAMRALGNTILQEAVRSLVQVGLQQVKNAVLSDTLAAAEEAKMVARMSVNGSLYSASVAAQVQGMAAMAAQNAFAATAAIPIVGPALAPEAAAAAGAAAAAIGAPAVATAPLAGARQYGGAVTGGSLYRVNETGQSEMFVGANGNQYMIPGRNGRVIAANDLSSGGTSTGGGVMQNNTFHISIDASSNASMTSQSSNAGMNPESAKQLAQMISAGAKDTLAREMRPGGLIWKMKQG